MKTIAKLSVILLSMGSALVLTACDPGTPLGNLFHEPRNYVSSARAQNNTSQPMTIGFSVSESISENACASPHYAKSEMTLQPGETKEIAVNLHCDKSHNWLSWRMTVSADGFHKSYGVSTEWVEFAVVCVQGSCDVNAHCHGSGSCIDL